MKTPSHSLIRHAPQTGQAPIPEAECLAKSGRNALGKKPDGARGFTMIEMMIVVGLAALIMSMGIPSFVKLLNKDPMRQTIADILEACGEARAQAIISGTPSELRIRPGERSMAIGAAAREPESGEFGHPGEPAQTGSRPVTPVVTGKGFPKKISDRVNIEMLDVNLKEFKDADEARVRFYPNGTSDEFTIIISWTQSNEYRQVTLDSISGMASMGVIR